MCIEICANYCTGILYIHVESDTWAYGLEEFPLPLSHSHGRREKDGHLVQAEEERSFLHRPTACGGGPRAALWPTAR